MSELFDGAGVPVWLPEDFDGREVNDGRFLDVVNLSNVRDCRIIVVMNNGSEIEKHFTHNEYPAAIEAWDWIKYQIEVDNNKAA